MNRKLLNKLYQSSTWLAVVLSLVILCLLIGILLYNGFSALSFDFLTSSTKDFGAKGGIAYQIIGSLLLVLGTAFISFPIALGTALYKSEYIVSKRWQLISNVLIYLLNGIPSVIFGIFGLIFFVNVLGTGISWFVGSIILAMMILPTIILSAYQSINNVPAIYRESGLALGLSKWQMILKVLLPHGLRGATTGLLIGLARAIGETAPIMFIATAFSGVKFPNSLNEPVLSLPTHILALAQQATNPLALSNAWGASLVLIIMVMILSGSAFVIRSKYQKVQ